MDVVQGQGGLAMQEWWWRSGTMLAHEGGFTLVAARGGTEAVC